MRLVTWRCRKRDSMPWLVPMLTRSVPCSRHNRRPAFSPAYFTMLLEGGENMILPLAAIAANAACSILNERNDCSNIPVIQGTNDQSGDQLLASPLHIVPLRPEHVALLPTSCLSPGAISFTIDTVVLYKG